MNNRPKRSIKPPKNLKEYILVSEVDSDSVKESLLKKHEKLLQLHHTADNSLFKCNKCDTVFKNKSQLINHLRKKHKDNISFLCDECGKCLSNSHTFSEHMNIHENYRPHKCEICGHGSRHLSVHFRHMQVHTRSAESYECSICSKKFRQKDYLKRHTRKHLGEKPYKCDLCPKAFSAKTELNRHNVCHLSLRPFSCEHCNKTFKLKHNLSAHIKAHTGIQLWKCCLCKASFPQQSLMEKHKTLHTEMIQHLELTKVDKRTLAITSYPLDRRKIPHHQKVSLPPKLDLNDLQNTMNANVSLALNDAVIPISVIANSFGTGNYIKMKIIDQINQKSKTGSKLSPSAKEMLNAVLVEESTTVVEDGSEEQDDVMLTVNPETKPQCNGSTETEEINSPVMRQLCSHLDSFENAFDTNVLDDDKIMWLRTLKDMAKDLSFPLHHHVSHQLHIVIVKVQKMLISNTYSDPKRLGTSIDLHAPSCEFCTLSPTFKNSPQYDGNESETMDSASELQLVDEKLPGIDSSKTITDKIGFKVMICSSNSEDQQLLTKNRYCELYELYLFLSKVIQNHLSVGYESVKTLGSP